MLAIATNLVFTAPKAHACSCMQQSVAEGVQGADAVFEAQVRSVALDGPSPMALRRAMLEVRRVWKGEVQPSIEIGTASNSAACGFSFSEGDSYLVYARQTDRGLRTGLCSRTKLITNASEDLAELGEGRLVAIDKANDIPAEPPPKTSKCGCNRCAIDLERTPAPTSGLFILALLIGVVLRRRQR